MRAVTETEVVNTTGIGMRTETGAVNTTGIGMRTETGAVNTTGTRTETGAITMTAPVDGIGTGEFFADGRMACAVQQNIQI